MSDPTNPYGTNRPSAEVGYPAQPTYGEQFSYGTNGAYGGPQAGYGAGAAYGAQPQYGGPPASYGQPVYGQPVYMLNPAVERLRSHSTMVRIMALASFITLGPLISIPATIWAGSLIREARDMGAPADVESDLRGARTMAGVCSIIGILGIVAFFVLPLLITFLAVIFAGA